MFVSGMGRLASVNKIFLGGLGNLSALGITTEELIAQYEASKAMEAQQQADREQWQQEMSEQYVSNMEQNGYSSEEAQARADIIYNDESINNPGGVAYSEQYVNSIPDYGTGAKVEVVSKPDAVVLSKPPEVVSVPLPPPVLAAPIKEVVSPVVTSPPPTPVVIDIPVIPVFTPIVNPTQSYTSAPNPTGQIDTSLPSFLVGSQFDPNVIAERDRLAQEEQQRQAEEWARQQEAERQAQAEAAARQEAINRQLAIDQAYAEEMQAERERQAREAANQAELERLHREELDRQAAILAQQQEADRVARQAEIDRIAEENRQAELARIAEQQKLAEQVIIPTSPNVVTTPMATNTNGGKEMVTAWGQTILIPDEFANAGKIATEMLNQQLQDAYRANYGIYEQALSNWQQNGGYGPRPVPPQPPPVVTEEQYRDPNYVVPTGGVQYIPQTGGFLDPNVSGYINPNGGGVGPVVGSNNNVGNGATGTGSGGTVITNQQNSKAVGMTFTNLTSGNIASFKVGDKWRIVITGPANSPVVVFGTGPNSNFSGGTSQGNTDGYGNFTLDGVMAQSHIGNWIERWTVGGTTAGNVSFSVIPAVSSGVPNGGTNTNGNGTETNNSGGGTSLVLPDFDFKAWLDKEMEIAGYKIKYEYLAIGGVGIAGLLWIASQRGK